MITRVQQEHQYGCQVAVLAMIIGTSYQQALTYYPGNPDEYKGFSSHTLDTILTELGFAVARKYKVRGGFSNEERPVWPCEPFGYVHWCQVDTAAGGHAIVMLHDGTVLDPWDCNRTSLDHPHYIKVNSITAITAVDMTTHLPKNT